MLIDNLKKMSREELVTLARTQNAKHHHKASTENIIKAIMDTVTHPPKPQSADPVDPRLATPKPTVWNSREEVEQMLEPIKAKAPQFEAIFHDDQTVTFKCRGAEDSMSLSVPLRWMREKANTVSRGRIALMGLNEHFKESGFNPGSAKNAYTNTVLAG